jgi:hypothetical protein
MRVSPRLAGLEEYNSPTLAAPHRLGASVQFYVDEDYGTPDR